MSLNEIILLGGKDDRKNTENNEKVKQLKSRTN